MKVVGHETEAENIHKGSTRSPFSVACYGGETSIVKARIEERVLIITLLEIEEKSLVIRSTLENDAFIHPTVIDMVEFALSERCSSHFSPSIIGGLASVIKVSPS